MPPLRLHLMNRNQFQRHQHPNVTCHCDNYPDAYKHPMPDDLTDENSTTTMHVCTHDLSIIRCLAHTPEQRRTADRLPEKLSLGPSGRLNPSVSEDLYTKSLHKGLSIHMQRQKKVLGLPPDHWPDALIDLAATCLAKATLEAHRQNPATHTSLPDLTRSERNPVVEAQKKWFIIDGDKDASTLATTCRDSLPKNMRRELDRPHCAVQALLDYAKLPQNHHRQGQRTSLC